MNILMLTPYVPHPPSSGGQIRTFNLLKYLSKRHQITLVVLYKNNEEKRHYEPLKQYCKNIYLCKRAEKPWQLSNILQTLFSFMPFLIIRNYSTEASSVIGKLLKKEKFDVIHAETFYIMPHIPQTTIPILLVEQTIEYKVYQHFINSLPYFVRFLFYFDIVKLKYWERFYWRKATVVATVSHSDERMIKRLEPSIRTTIVPNGAGDEMVVDELYKKSLKNPSIFFQGNFFWLQNVEAARFLIEKIYPQLIRSIPNLHIIVSGQNAQKISQFHRDNLLIMDILPDDTESVKKLFRQSTLFIAPIFGPGGTRLKILAAMASGLPVISTKVGVEGLDVKDRVHVLIANSEKDFVTKIKNILTNRRLYETIRKNAYELVKEKYNWKTIAQTLEIVYTTIKKNENRH